MRTGVGWRGGENRSNESIKGKEHLPEFLCLFQVKDEWPGGGGCLTQCGWTLLC